MARSMPRYRRATFPRAEDACLISWTLELSANYGFFLEANFASTLPPSVSLCVCLPLHQTRHANTAASEQKTDALSRIAVMLSSIVLCTYQHICIAAGALILRAVLMHKSGAKLLMLRACPCGPGATRLRARSRRRLPSP